jgi:hypothetical protein
VVWYFFSDKNWRRALAAAEKVIVGRSRDYLRTDHLRFRFHRTVSPSPPPFDKWQEQKECERQEARRRERERREELERRERERRHAEAVATAEQYLSTREQEKAVEAAQNRKYEEGRGWQLTRQEQDQALIDAVMRKHEREQEKERRR